MKLLSVINKSFKEQIRSFWIFVLTISMAPMFILIYYMIIEGDKQDYELIIINRDIGANSISGEINYGNQLIDAAESIKNDTLKFPVNIEIYENRLEAENRLQNRNADALIIIPENFSVSVQNKIRSPEEGIVEVEFIGDLTSFNYIISAIWANEVLDDYISGITNGVKRFSIKETSLGISGEVNDFDIAVPGIMLIAIIMLMFSATIAIVAEVEGKTITRLKLSKLSTLELLTGISVIQILIAVISVLLTLLIAVWLGFNYRGSFLIMLFISTLTSISIIAFSLIIAAATKTVSEVMVVSNFPLFLFWFFSGVAFPIKGHELFSIWNYPITIQGLMSPAHSVSALKKVMIFNMGFSDILPEITALIILTILYFAIGIWTFRYRHMRIE